jgi:outer membrane receptor protein involved in Fe transport
MLKVMRLASAAWGGLFFLCAFPAGAQTTTTTVSGAVLDPQGKSVPAAVVKVVDGVGRARAQTSANAAGLYSVVVTGAGPYAFVAEANGFDPVATELKTLTGGDLNVDLNLGQLAKAGVVMTVTEKVVEPTVDQRDGEMFAKTLFTRDDQIFQSLGAGLSLGQHAGGGKSLEVRRFGFNLDHGGVGGGLRVVMDNILLNQVSGGHAHGYLGALKGISPELVENVNLINGPFNAMYGDFSGLGVVNVKSREEMPERITGRVQFGQFNTRRFFGAFSPAWKDTKALLANEFSYSDGPFQSPLRYKRNNTTASLARRLNARDTVGGRLWLAYSDYYAAGQLPVDQVEQGKLDRFGFIDPTDGGNSRTGTAQGYFVRDFGDGSTLRVDGMVQRLLFDLYSNFTFFLNNEEGGDAFGQHDSRLQQAANVQYTKAHTLGAGLGSFSAGFNHLDNQINLTLYNRIGRVPTDLTTAAHTRIANPGFYAQENMTLLQGKIQLGVGLRRDDFWFRFRDRVDPLESGTATGGAWQPKASFSFTPSSKIPLTLHTNYGRAITSTNARALLTDPASPRVAKTDFYQFGTSHNKGRVSMATSFYWIDRSNELVYVADDGSNEFVGPSRNYGFEVKSSFQLTRFLALNGSVTKVLNALYRGTEPREYVDRAPHFVSYSALTLTNWQGWSGSVRQRAVSRYILNGEESQARVPGHTVTDFSVAKTIARGVELNFAVDNIFNKSYFETFELYTSRLRGQLPLERVHGTPGYPRTIVGGLTFRLLPKKL